MTLLPIELDKAENNGYLHNPECIPYLEIYPEYYRTIGFNKPWIGYFASIDDESIVGTGGFKGEPKNGTVEIAYGTFKPYEGRGLGTEICRQLVLVALRYNPSIQIIARTLQDGSASITILQKNGFRQLGIVHDADDGDVLEWEFVKKNS